MHLLISIVLLLVRRSQIPPWTTDLQLKYLILLYLQGAWLVLMVLMKILWDVYIFIMATKSHYCPALAFIVRTLNESDTLSVGKSL